MRRAKDIELAFTRPPEGSSRQQWLYGEIRATILAGRLKSGAQLPASRDFARQAGVSRGTVIAVFDQLAAEGYLTGAVNRPGFAGGRLV